MVSSNLCRNAHLHEDIQGFIVVLHVGREALGGPLQSGGLKVGGAIFSGLLGLDGFKRLLGLACFFF